MENARIALALLRRDFPTFARKVFPTASRGEELSHDRYLDVLFQAAIDVYEGSAKRLVLNVPPRHGKTLAFVVPLAAWWIANRPTAQIMVLSFRDGLADQIVDHVGGVLAAGWFKEAFPQTKVRVGHNRAGDFGTNSGGRVFAHHLGRGITGEGADLIIVDDPSDISDAERPEALATIRDIFDNVVRNRLNHPMTGCIAIIGHRVHADDLSGHVLSEEGWAHVNLPFIAERDEAYATPVGVWQRSQGELLQPDGFPPAEVSAIRSRRNFRSVYQQAPEGDASWQLTPEDFPFFAEVPHGAGGAVLSVDTAQQAGAGHSFSVVQAWRSLAGHHYLLDQLRVQVSTTDLEKALLRFINKHWASAVVIENTGFGTSLLERLNRRASPSGMRVIAATTENRSKFERFASVVPIIQARRVHVLRDALWSSAYIQELTEFPGSAADDQVDATSQFLEWGVNNPTVPHRPARALFVGKTDGGRTYRPEAGGSLEPRPGRHIFVRRP